MDALNSAIILLNHEGRLFCGFAGGMLLQSSILVGLLLLADLGLRARVCARFRYGIWLLVLVKLLLPPSLALPTGAGYWLGRYLPAAPAVSPPAAPAISLALPAYVPPLPEVIPMPVGAPEMAVAGREIVPLQWPGLLLLGWVAGVLLLSTFVWWRVAWVRRSLHRSHPARQQMVDLLEECRAKLGITTPVTLRLTDDIRSPAVCGFARPVILLPTALPAGLWPEGVRTILTHELAHIKRHDPWVSLAQTALQVIYFWHPLVWAANARLRHLRELAVDETVLVTLRSQAQCYTNTLIDIAEMAFRKPAFSLRLIGIAESKRALERRITHMLNRHISNPPALGLSGLLAIMALGALLVPMGRGTMTARAEPQAVQSVPALPEGIAELFQLSKDDILEKFGQPARTFGNYMAYEDLSFCVPENDVVQITLLTSRYAFGNGIRVGDSEEKVKGAFGPDYVLKETEAKDFLIYDALGVNFEIDKGDRSVMEINIDREYGEPARLQAYAHAAERAAQRSRKVAQRDLDSARLEQVPALPEGIAELFGLSKDSILEKFGEPKRIFWGDKTFTLDDLPDEYFLPYDDLSFGMSDGVVVGITLLSPTYVFGNGIRVGDSEEKVKQAFGPPSEVEETEFKDFLIYEPLGLSFEIHKQDRSVMEINIKRDYGDPAQLQAYARAVRFNAQLPARVARLDLDAAGLEQVLALFGPPVKYVWGQKTLSADALPDRFIAVYPGGFNVFMMDNHIVELRFENNSTYMFAGKLRIGSTLEEALAVLGAPAQTVEGKPISWSASENVLFKDIDGQKGRCYYHRPDHSVRLWFANYKITAIYMTRSDYNGYGIVAPFDPEFARLLQERVAALDIDSASLEQVRAIFGEPSKYAWGDQTFTADALPDKYIMCYPCSFNVYMNKGRIMEIRHERASPYVYRGTLRIGSTLDEALALLGQPDETVTGQKNAFKDAVLYRDIDGTQGHDYYHRADQRVRIWFWEDKVIAIYMTRSDFPTH